MPHELLKRSCKRLRTYHPLLENITRVRLGFGENEAVILLGLRFLATFGEAGAAQNAAPPQRVERHLSHLAMSSPTTRLTVCRGDTKPVPRHRHREAHH
jgi:hypothetical protein